MGFRGVREASGFSRAKPVPQPSRHAQKWRERLSFEAIWPVGGSNAGRDTDSTALKGVLGCFDP